MFTPTTLSNPPVYYNKITGKRDGMEYARLGSTGVVVSRICLGIVTYTTPTPDGLNIKGFDWIIQGEEGEKFIKQALDAGINFFDTAESYNQGGSEAFLGIALKKLLPGSRFKREDLVIATKIHPNREIMVPFIGMQTGLTRKAIFDAVEGSLKRLQLDYIDLCFIHRFDPDTAIEETMKALHDLVEAGKIRYIGASSMFAWQFQKMQNVAEKHGWTKFSVMQNLYNALYREEEREMIPYCVHAGVAVLPWSPLAGGTLARPAGQDNTIRSETLFAKIMKNAQDGDDDVIQAVQEIAKNRGVSQAIVSLAWILQKQGVVAPIIGATKPHHISDAVSSLSFELTPEEVKMIEKCYRPHTVFGHA
jgi:aryl-alcohol dehydrogenase (NADP+)